MRIEGLLPRKQLLRYSLCRGIKVCAFERDHRAVGHIESCQQAPIVSAELLRIGLIGAITLGATFHLSFLG